MDCLRACLPSTSGGVLTTAKRTLKAFQWLQWRPRIEYVHKSISKRLCLYKSRFRVDTGFLFFQQTSSLKSHFTCISSCTAAYFTAFCMCPQSFKCQLRTHNFLLFSLIKRNPSFRLQVRSLIAKIKDKNVQGSVQVILENPRVALLPDDESPGYPIHVACCVGVKEIVQCMIAQLPDHGRWILVPVQTMLDRKFLSVACPRRK